MLSFQKLFLCLGLLACSLIHQVHSYSSGAGACPAGKAAIGGSHSTMGTIKTGALVKGGFQMLVAGTAVGNGGTAKPGKKTFSIQVKGATFKGILIRVNGATSAQVVPGSGLAASSVCGKKVGSATHTSASAKKSGDATVTVSAAGSYKVDVTVVVKNSGGVSEYYYSAFTVTV